MKQKLTNADLKPDLAKAEKELQDLLERAEVLREWITITKKLAGKRPRGTELQAETVTVFTRRRTKTAVLAAQVKEVLRSSGRPMHVMYIAQALAKEGHPVTAKNPVATIAVALSRRPEEFTKTGPNTFFLKETEAKATG
jgi:hypothetical protein